MDREREGSERQHLREYQEKSRLGKIARGKERKKLEHQGRREGEEKMKEVYSRE